MRMFGLHLLGQEASGFKEPFLLVAAQKQTTTSRIIVCVPIEQKQRQTQTLHSQCFCALLAAVASRSSCKRFNSGTPHERDDTNTTQTATTIMSQQQPSIANNTLPSSSTDDIQEDWEEWDGRSPFWIHCVAGSLAGVTEHTAVYPLDTVRTHIQVCASCVHKGKMTNKIAAMDNNAALLRSAIKPNKPQLQHLPVGMWQTIRYLVNEPTATLTASATTTSAPIQGWSRLWRGVQTILIGCIPAHALYFSSYEAVKAATSTHRLENGQMVTQVSPLSSSLAGAAAVFSHDFVMTPVCLLCAFLAWRRITVSGISDSDCFSMFQIETLKQRLQLGHYDGSTRTALHSVVRNEGWVALYRSFPVTLVSNVPYGIVMVSTNEFVKEALSRDYEGSPTWQTVLVASSLGGLVASAVTTPLDRIKTALQTQQLAPACRLGNQWQKLQQQNCQFQQQPHLTWKQAAVNILREEGPAGFFRGIVPRVLSHTPAVAISWTTYETAKHYLLQRYP